MLHKNGLLFCGLRLDEEVINELRKVAHFEKVFKPSKNNCLEARTFQGSSIYNGKLLPNRTCFQKMQSIKSGFGSVTC